VSFVIKLTFPVAFLGVAHLFYIFKAIFSISIFPALALLSTTSISLFLSISLTFPFLNILSLIIVVISEAPFST
jgi:hypothetical protein